jgi:hypothetical protein
MILVYAGRRVDPAITPGREPAEQRFPLSNVPRVAREVTRVLGALLPSIVVGSGACGADLLVLEAAGALGMRRRIILPFDRTTFRARSVADRPGDWGGRFDQAVKEVSIAGDLLELAFDPTDEATFVRATLEIFRDAETLARSAGQDCRALVIWNGVTRGAGDVTATFLNEADRRGWSPVVIDTLK